MRLLYCSLGNTQLQFDEPYRSALPVNSTTCECYDFTSARCIAWCTILPISNFEIVEHQSSGIFDVTCPLEKKVIGCHIHPLQSDNVDYGRQFYPNDDGSKCICSDFFGATCIATCASNITSYEIVFESENHYVNVQCSQPDNKVLGCGGSPSLRSVYSRVYLAESWRTVQVQNETSCTCYDAYGITCYAICGQLL